MNHITERLKIISALKNKDLKGHVLRGSIWVLLGHAASIILRLGSSLILTRLLFPEAFGIMALVQVFLFGLQMFSDVGTGSAIIQNKKGDDPVFLNTAWTIQVIRGLLLWGGSILVAWPISSFYNEPLLKILLVVTGFTAVINGFNSTSLFNANRNLQMGKLTIIELASQFTSIIVMISWSYISPTIWALVGGGFASPIVTLVLGYIYLPSHRHTFQLDAHVRKELFHFGKWIFCSTALAFLALQADKLVFGKMLGTAILGVYSIALNIAKVPTTITQKLCRKIVFPALSSKIRTAGFSGDAFHKTREPIVLITAILSVVFIGTGDPLIKGLYDARYEDAGWMLSLLAIGGFIRGIQEPLRGILLATGRTKGLAIGNGLKLVGLSLLFPLAAKFGNLYFIIWAFVVTDFLKYIAFIFYVSDFKLKVLRKDVLLFAIVLITSCMALLIVSMLRHLWPGLHQLVFAAIASGAAIVAFLGFYYPAKRTIFRNIY